MIPKEWVDYVRTNRDKFSLPAIKQGLIQSGATPELADEAIAAATIPPTAEAHEAPAPAAAALAAAEPAAGAQALSGGLERDLRVFVSPRMFFREMPKSGGYGRPLLFASGAMLTSLLLRIVVNAYPLLYGAHRALSLVSTLEGAIAGLILGMIICPPFLFVCAGVMHVLWMLLGSKQSYETSFRCVAYGCFLWPLSSIAAFVPLVNVMPAIIIGLIWLFFQVMISKEVHEISEEKAWPAFGAVFFLLFIAPLARELSTVLPRRAPLGGTLPGVRVNAPSVSFNALSRFVPKPAPGLALIDLKGREAPHAGAGMAITYARYKPASGGQLEVSIKDITGMGPPAVAAIHAALTTKTDRKTKRGYTRSILVGKYAGLEAYDYQNRMGRIELAVGPRIVVQVQGSQVAIEAVREFLKQIDLAKLELLSPMPGSPRR